MADPKHGPEVIEDDALDDAASGASGVSTGKRQHKPFVATAPADTAGEGAATTITYTGLE